MTRYHNNQHLLCQRSISIKSLYSRVTDSKLNGTDFSCMPRRDEAENFSHVFLVSSSTFEIDLAVNTWLFLLYVDYKGLLVCCSTRFFSISTIYLHEKADTFSILESFEVALVGVELVHAIVSTTIANRFFLLFSISQLVTSGGPPLYCAVFIWIV